MQLSTPDNARTIFKCSCLDGHCCESSIELQSDDGEYWFFATSYPPTLWSCLNWWWKHRKIWWLDLRLTREDLLKLKEIIEKN